MRPKVKSSFSSKGLGQNEIAIDAPVFEWLARRSEGAYPQRSVTEEQRSQPLKDQADLAISF
jgi:hypothetical protein